jgi:hypothetical protein
VAALAAAEGVDLEFRALNLCELRSTLTEAALIAHRPGPKVVTARHLADATDAPSRERLWRACEMMLRGGGRLYVEFLVSRGKDDPFAKDEHLRVLPIRRVVQQLQQRGATIVKRTTNTVSESPEITRGHRIGRVVAEWQR